MKTPNVLYFFVINGDLPTKADQKDTVSVKRQACKRVVLLRVYTDLISFFLNKQQMKLFINRVFVNRQTSICASIKSNATTEYVSAIV